MAYEAKSQKTTQELSVRIERYLAANPQLREAIEMFNISLDTYNSILAANQPRIITSSSSTPQ